MWTSRPTVNPAWARMTPGKLLSAIELGQVGARIVADAEPRSPRALHRSFRVFRTILKVRRASFLGPYRLHQLFRLAMMVDREGVAGDYVECGVYRGGSAALLAHAADIARPSRHLWLFDSFAGLPAPTGIDGPGAVHLQGDLVGSEQDVLDLLRRVGAQSARVHIVQGWFEDTLPVAPIERVALLHIDADWYESIKLCLELFYDRVAPGGVVVLDDYDEWPGCRAALHEFADARTLPVVFDRTGRLVPYFRKPG